ncbi:MAG: ribosome biogenesis GTP-binding protein YihA/YsxC [Pseudomonadota bacterium]|nr:ribosome biogenesis GTP-binding protein YihA/YsxC [Pseudomonadota bacterium]
MKPLTLKFVKSAPGAEHLPPDQGKEIILAGYSNVGKSSIINKLSNTNNLAKCSKTPGRTQLFNVFEVSTTQRILDLPGYGFARVSIKTQQQWLNRLHKYLATRECLGGVVLITDIRRGLRPMDMDLAAWAHEHDIPLIIVLNKADKLSKSATMKAKQKILTTINIDEDAVLPTSCLKRSGIPELLSMIKMWLEISG